MGRWQEAESHFEQALAMNAKMAAKPWLAHTQFQYAHMLLERSTDGDLERARMRLDESETLARQLGMRALETRIATARRQASAGG
jgi:hypothetical protein